MGIAHARDISDETFLDGDIAKNLAGWTDLGDNGSALTQLDRAGGGIKITMDGTDNDNEVAEYMGESIDPLTIGRKFGFRARVKITEADTTNYDSDWFIGFSDTPTDFFADADTIVSGVHIGIAKLTGASAKFFRRIVQQAATNSGDTGNGAIAFVSATEYDLECHAQVVDRAGTAYIKASFYVDGVKLGDTVTVVSTSYGLMAPIFAISTNGANAEVFELHSFVPYQTM